MKNFEDQAKDLLGEYQSLGSLNSAMNGFISKKYGNGGPGWFK